MRNPTLLAYPPGPLLIKFITDKKQARLGSEDTKTRKLTTFKLVKKTDLKMCSPCSGTTKCTHAFRSMLWVTECEMALLKKGVSALTKQSLE